MMNLLEIPLEQIDSVALRRLVQEVRDDQLAGVPARYNRVYTRHNRS